MRRGGRTAVGLWVLLTLTCFLLLLGLSAGSVTIPWTGIFQSITGAQDVNPVWGRILWQIRLPRCLAAVMGGACLALSGLEMQTLFRNPLAGPYTLGISSGATLGVAMAVLAGVAVGNGALPQWMAMGGGWAQLGVAGSAVLGAGTVMVLVLLLSKVIRGNTTLLILGLMFGQLAGALVSILQVFSTAEQIRSFTFWTFGSYAGVTWGQMPFLAGSLGIGLALAGYCAKPLNALLLGWTYARSVGVPVRTLRILLLASASILAGVVTAFCGPIAFLGLAVPHLCRGFFRTADHRILIPACVFLGASLSLASDLVCRLPGNGRVLPLNAVTSMVGAPIVIWVLLRRRSRSEEVESE